jgi:hypothetical protein
MTKLHRLQTVLMIAGASGIAIGAVRGEANLIESNWIAQPQDCAIREIKFYDFGHALVTADKLGTDEADWRQDKAMVHVRFNHWNGALDGALEGDREFDATYTWRSDETLAATAVPCRFRRE